MVGDEVVTKSSSCPTSTATFLPSTKFWRLTHSQACARSQHTAKGIFPKGTSSKNTLGKPQVYTIATFIRYKRYSSSAESARKHTHKGETRTIQISSARSHAASGMVAPSKPGEKRQRSALGSGLIYRSRHTRVSLQRLASRQASLKKNKIKHTRRNCRWYIYKECRAQSDSPPTTAPSYTGTADHHEVTSDPRRRATV